MRILHLILIVFFLALAMALWRDTIGRVALVVLVTGLVEFLLAAVALFQLFDTVHALGEARGLLEHLSAIVLTSLVLMAASVSMNAVLWVGIALVQSVVP